MALKYQRILLKISGEALGGEKGTGFDEPTMDAICGGVKKAHDLGVQIGIVVGGGNFWRGRSSGKMERTLADKIGMLATVMNALAVSDKLEQLGVPTEERRKQLAKEVSKLGEEAKVAVRNIRRDAMDKAKVMKKAGELTEDSQKTMEEDVQKLTDKYIKNIDAAVEEKQKEIMSV